MTCPSDLSPLIGSGVVWGAEGQGAHQEPMAARQWIDLHRGLLVFLLVDILCHNTVLLRLLDNKLFSVSHIHALPRGLALKLASVEAVPRAAPLASWRGDGGEACRFVADAEESA